MGWYAFNELNCLNFLKFIFAHKSPIRKELENQNVNSIESQSGPKSSGYLRLPKALQPPDRNVIAYLFL